MVYDLLVVGNGVSAQTLLFELIKSQKKEDTKCQIFSIAQIFSEKYAPACSLRSTSTISLNGIEDGVSELGDVLRKGYFAFESFYKENQLEFVEKVKQIVVATKEKDISSLKRRYNNISAINDEYLKIDYEGVSFQSYILDPVMMNDWFNDKIENSQVKRFDDFILYSQKNSDGIIETKTQKDIVIKSKIVVFCTGAYSSVFSNFFPLYRFKVNQSVVAGSFLHKKIKLPKSFILTVDGHNLIYRKLDEVLILGSASYQGALQVCDLSKLKDIFNLMKEVSKIDLGLFEDFSVINGLRHKASKRLPVYGFLDENKQVATINGLYKNGYSLSFYLSKLLAKEITSLL